MWLPAILEYIRLWPDLKQHEIWEDVAQALTCKQLRFEVLQALMRCHQRVDTLSKAAEYLLVFPLFTAVYEKCQPVLDQLRDMIDEDIDSTFGGELLHGTAEADCDHLATKLLAMDVNISFKICASRRKGWTTPISAAADGHLKMVKFLVEKGGDVTVADNDGWTPLRSAASNGYLKVVKLLLEKGADTTLANNDGWTPLNSAADSGHLEGVKLLLEKGVDVHHLNELGQSSLHLSVYTNRIHVVKCLIEYGANPYVVDCFGRSSLDWASEHGALLEAMGHRDGDFRTTPIREQFLVLRKSVRFLIDKTMSLDEDRLMHEIGHCLIHLQDLSEARQALRQRLELEQTTNSIVHQA